MKLKKITAVISATAVLACSGYFSSSIVSAESGSSPDAYYNLSSYSIKKSFLTETFDGYMRVYVPDKEKDNNIRIEYFDKSFNLMSKKSVPRELEYWGGFFEGKDNYFTIEGTANKDEIDSNEVIRVNKYDKSWNKLGTAKITSNGEMFGGQVRYPFDYGCCEVTELNGNLYIGMGHQGYVDESVGQGHQGLLLLMVDENTMTGKVADCDLWHSFSQYLTNDGSSIYLLEESEGSRISLLTKYNPADLPADYFDSQDEATILKYGGNRESVWSVATYASCNGITLSDNNVLTLGTSIDQSKYGNDYTYNIYLGVTPKNNVKTESTELKWITNIPSSSENSFYGNGVSDAEITKINDNRFMISWNQRDESSDYSNKTLSDYNDPLSENKLHYIFIDGNGNKLSNEYTVDAAFSDCRPIYNGSEVVFYASDDNTVDFYTINASTGDFNKKVCKSAGDLLGDINGDGSIDSKDAVLVLKSYAESLVSGENTFYSAGDINGDDKVDSKDAVIILKYYAATLTGFSGDISEFI